MIANQYSLLCIQIIFFVELGKQSRS